jgi:hypothetical protein
MLRIFEHFYLAPANRLDSTFHTDQFERTGILYWVGERRTILFALIVERVFFFGSGR